MLERPSLSTVAKQINEDHLKIVEADRKSLYARKKLGDKIISLKARIVAEKGHGHWLKWWAENCKDISGSTRDDYRKLAKNWDKIKPFADDPDLSMRTFKRILEEIDAAPPDEPDDSDGPIDRRYVIYELESVAAGLSERGIIEQSDSFVFKDGRVFTCNDEIACSRPSCLKVSGAVDGKSLLAMLNALPDESLSVEVDDGELIIQGKRRTVGVKLVPDICLPELDETPAKWTKLPDGFTDAVKLCVPVASRDESRQRLTCVHIHPEWIEASDNYQALRVSIRTRFPQSCLVRVDSIRRVVSLKPTKFALTKRWLHFQTDDGLMWACRVFKEDFPDLSPHLKPRGVEVKLPRKLADAAQRASIATKDNPDTPAVLVTLSRRKASVVGQGRHASFRESMKCGYDGETLRFLIDPGLLAKIIKRRNRCRINDSKALFIEGEGFVYAACLGEAVQN